MLCENFIFVSLKIFSRWIYLNLFQIRKLIVTTEIESASNAVSYETTMFDTGLGFMGKAICY